MTDTSDRYLFQVRLEALGQRELQALAEDWKKLGDSVRYAFRQSAAEAASVITAVERLGRSLYGSSQGYIGLAARLFTAKEAADLTKQAFDALFEVLNEGIKVDLYERQLTVLLGGADRAKAKLEELRGFANTYGLNFDGLVRGARELETVGIDSSRALRILSGVSITTGKSIDELTNALAGLQRGNYRSFLQLVPAGSSSVLAAEADMYRGVHKSAEDLQKLVGAALNDLQRQYGSALDEIKDITASRLGALQSRWQQFVERIYKSGLGEAYADLINGILAELERLEKDGSIRRFAEAFANAATAAVRGVLWLARAIPPLIGVLKALAVALLVGGALITFIELMSAAPQVITFVTLAIANGLEPALAAATVNMTALAAAIDLATAPLTIITLIVTGLVLTFQKLREKTDKPFTFKVKDETNYAEVHAKLIELERERIRLLERQKLILDQTAHTDPLSGWMTSRIAGLDEVNRLLAKSNEEIEKARRADEALFSQEVQGPQLPPDWRKQKTEYDQETLNKQVEEANKAVTAVGEAVSRITTLYADGVKRRTELARAEGRDQVQATVDAQREEYAALITAGGARAKLLADLEAETQAKLAAIRAGHATGTVKAEQERQLRDAEAGQRRAIDIAISTGIAQRDITEQNAKASAEAETRATQEAARERAKVAVEDARFERDLYGLTSDQYIVELQRRLDSFRGYAAETRALNDELEAAIRKADQDALRQRERIIALMQRGLPYPTATRVNFTEENISKAQAGAKDALDADLARKVDYYARLQGIDRETYESMSAEHKKMYESDIQLALEAQQRQKNLYDLTAALAADLFRDLTKKDTDQAKTKLDLLSLTSIATQKNAKEAIASALDQAAGELKARAIVDAVLALEGLARAFIFHDPAALKGAAAAAEAAALAGGKSIALAAAAREEHALAIQAGEEGSYGSYGDSGGGSSNKAQASTLAVSSANVPVTMNFYITESFAGGVYFMGPGVADMLVQQLVPALQRAFDNRQLVVH